ncbi:MAG: hypothetical protein ACO1RX_14415 [Candidatus Sericytochromatia bacterium]
MKTVFLIASLLVLAVNGRSVAAAQHPADRYADAYKRYIAAPFPIPQDGIQHFVYFARDREAMRTSPFLTHSRLVGAQIMYPWALLEPHKDVYDFSMIAEDQAYLKSKGKKLFVQLQDATFDPALNAVPAYLLTKAYDGGALYQRDESGNPEGWVAKRWNPQVRERFSKLLAALGREFDGKIEGINLQETSIGVSSQSDPSFSDALYAEAVKANMWAMKQAFKKSVTMQYANFMPGEWLPSEDRGYLRSIYRYGEQIGVGLGGPDLMFTKRGQLNHLIALMHENRYSVPLGIAVQDGNYIGETNTDRVVPDHPNLVPALHGFAKDFMRVNYLFWAHQEPYFTQDVLPSFSPLKETAAVR